MVLQGSACALAEGLCGEDGPSWLNELQQLSVIAACRARWLVVVGGNVQGVCVIEGASCFLFWKDVGGEAKHIAQGSL